MIKENKKCFGLRENDQSLTIYTANNTEMVNVDEANTGQDDITENTVKAQV